MDPIMDKAPSLSVPELEDLMIAVDENAGMLVEDAMLLLDAGRVPRAYALAELAAEELGKLLMVSATAVDVALGQPFDWPRFWHRFRDHRPKAWNIALMDHVLDGNVDAWRAGDIDAIKAAEAGFAQAKQNAAVMPQAKNRALYVDYVDARMRRPADSIPREWAEMMVAGVAKLAQGLKALGIPPRKGWLETIAADSGMRRRAEELKAWAKAADDPTGP
jgi:AbiV family abortive infection protein